MASQSANQPPRRSLLKTRWARITLIVLALLIVIRLVLPYVVLHYANRTLAEIPGYFGHVKDIDLALYRGAYQIKDIYLNKRDSTTGKQTKFFRSDTIDLSVEWRALWKGSLVGEVELYRPSLIFTKDKTEISDVKKDTSNFSKVIKDFMPLTLNRLAIHNGNVHYVDRSAKPDLDVSIGQIHLLAKNLNNSYDSTTALPASVTAQARAYEGTLSLNMRLDPLAESTTFDLNAELKNTNLVLLNDFLRAYGNFDVNKGTFGLYTELAAKQGRFKGYVKPVIKDLDVLGREDKKDPFLRKLWEALVGGAGNILTNPKKDQIATKVPLEGSFAKPITNTWEAVWEVLRNAFIQALVPSVDNQINLSSVGKDEKKDQNLIQRILSPDPQAEQQRKAARQEKRAERKKDKKQQ